MVLIIVATCAGMEVLSAISAQAAPLRPPWPLQPDPLFPVLSRWQLKDAGTDMGNISGATGVGAVAFRRRGEFTLPSIHAVGKVQRDGSGG
jgi:hypothetical protein